MTLGWLLQDVTTRKTGRRAHRICVSYFSHNCDWNHSFLKISLILKKNKQIDYSHPRQEEADSSRLSRRMREKAARHRSRCAIAHMSHAPAMQVDRASTEDTYLLIQLCLLSLPCTWKAKIFLKITFKNTVTNCSPTHACNPWQADLHPCRGGPGPAAGRPGGAAPPAAGSPAGTPPAHAPSPRPAPVMKDRLWGLFTVMSLPSCTHFPLKGTTERYEMDREGSRSDATAWASVSYTWPLPSTIGPSNGHCGKES